MTPDVTVIVPAHNGHETVGRCVHSILMSAGDISIEIVVVDDGSTDGTADILEALNEPRLHVVRTENRGVSAARNTGLSFVRGRYVTFVDCDDYVSESYIPTLLRYATRGYDLVISEAIDVDERGEVLGGKLTTEPCEVALSDGYDFDAPYGHSTAWGCLYELGLIRDLSFAEDLTVGEDTLFFHQAFLRAQRAIHLSFRGYFYVRSPGSTVGRKSASGFLDEATSWARVSELVALTSGDLSRHALSVAVRHASIGLLSTSRDTGGHDGLKRFVIENAWVGIADSLRRCRVRRAIMIMLSYTAARFPRFLLLARWALRRGGAA